ncbi:MAG TPA: pentapeptide repeat-containing protein [Puia sp.]|nr:pentapeptide repeat-containing protein [Puia sp.]
MEPTKIHNAQTRLDVSESVIDGSKFLKVMLKDCLFQDVMMAGARVKDANLSDLEIDGAQLGGAYIHNIGMPPKGHPLHDPQAKMRPLKFEDCNLEGSRIQDCNLSAVELINCNIKGLKIDGIDVSAALAEYRRK